MRLLIIVNILIALSPNGISAAAPPLKAWQKCLGGSLQDIPGEMVKLRDGNILLLSNVDSYDGDVDSNHGSTDIWLTKLDTSGNLLWQKSIGGTSIDIGTDVTEIHNGNIIVSGYTSSTNGDIPSNKGNFDALLLSTDPQGDILWIKIYGGSQVDLSYSLIQTNDGGFVLGGGSYSNDHDVSGNHGDQDFWIIKTDASGNLLWQQSNGGQGNDVCYALAKDQYENIYACGTTNSAGGNVTSLHGGYDIWVVKYTPAGSIIWNKTYGGSNYETAQVLLIDSQQNILIGGYTRSNDGDVQTNYGFGDSWVINIDDNGNLIKEKNFGGSGGDNLFSIIETRDGGYLFTSGSTSNDVDIVNNVGLEDVWLLKTNASLVTEWSYKYGGTGNDRPVASFQNDDDGFTIASYTFSNSFDVSGQHGASDVWLLRLICRMPTAFFSTQMNACLDDTLQFSGIITDGSSISWYLDQTLVSTTDELELHFNSPGYYQLNLSVQTCYNVADWNSTIKVIDCNLPLINFNASAIELCVNGQIQFTDVSTNATSRIWYFPGGNPASSTLLNPVVTYNQPGVYNVMLTAINSYGSQSATRLNYITVNVLPPKPVLTISGNALTAAPVAGHYDWYCNSIIIPGENSMNYLATVTGHYQVSVTDHNNCSNISDPVFYSPTSVNNVPAEKEFSIYPNPVSDRLYFNLPVGKKGKITIINMNGQRILERIVKANVNLPIDITPFADGIYSILFTDEEGETIQKTVIIE